MAHSVVAVVSRKRAVFQRRSRGRNLEFDGVVLEDALSLVRELHSESGWKKKDERRRR